jgi:leucyl aminopeptidase
MSTQPLRVAATTDSPAQTAADTVAIGLFDGEGIPHDVDGALAALLGSGEARPKLKHLALAHANGKRWLLVGLGDRATFDAERARVAAAAVVGRTRELATRSLCWELPHDVDDRVAAAFVEGTALAAYRFDSFKSVQNEEGARLEELLISAHDDVRTAIEEAGIVAHAVNRARDMQNDPPNAMTPTALGGHARELAGEVDGVEATVWGRAEIEDAGMGAFAAVASGSDEEPALIVLRYRGEGADGPRLGLVGKAVTFDSGGLAIKPAARMAEMKFDMSGGAAVIEAVGAIAALRLPVELIAVVGATENMVDSRAMRAGDIVRALNGTTIEVNNTDAEGRLVLADCLTHAIQLGADRIVDLATLTGAVLGALGRTYCGLVANDDAWAADVEEAASATGELAWRLPRHPEYAQLIEGRYADIQNVVESRIAGTVTAAEFLARFVGDVPWAHLDIAGTAWDLGRDYAPKGGSGFGVRLLVELARQNARA